MSLFHRHQWRHIATVVAKPITRMFEGGCSEAHFAKLVLGCTTFVWECDTCKASKTDEALGCEVTVKEALRQVAEKGRAGPVEVVK